MQTVKLPIVIAALLLAAVAGGVVSYVFFPSTDPEMKALLERLDTILVGRTRQREDRTD